MRRLMDKAMKSRGTNVSSGVLIVLVLVIGAVFLMSSCGNEEPEPSSQQPRPIPEQIETDVVTIAPAGTIQQQVPQQQHVVPQQQYVAPQREALKGISQSSTAESVEVPSTVPEISKPEPEWQPKEVYMKCMNHTFLGTEDSPGKVLSVLCGIYETVNPGLEAKLSYASEPLKEGWWRVTVRLQGAPDESPVDYVFTYHPDKDMVLLSSSSAEKMFGLHASQERAWRARMGTRPSAPQQADDEPSTYYVIDRDTGTVHTRSCPSVKNIRPGSANIVRERPDSSKPCPVCDPYSGERDVLSQSQRSAARADAGKTNLHGPLPKK